jgi:hypothetical protein
MFHFEEQERRPENQFAKLRLVKPKNVMKLGVQMAGVEPNE